LTVTAASTPGALLSGRDAEQPVGVDLEGDADARCASHHRRDSAQFEACQRPAFAHEFAFALNDMDRHRRLAVLEGGEFLRLCHRYRRVALDDAFDQSTHRLKTERQRDHVEQQQLAA
jgi:hypothetical protein